MRDRRSIVIAVAALGLIAAVAQHPTADLRVLTHEAGDPAPHRMQAAIDLGVVGISILYTWTTRRSL